MYNNILGLISRCRNFKQHDVTTVKGWSSILKLATQWGFTSIRELSVDALGRIASPVERLALAHAYDIDEWLLPAYSSLCQRAEPLTTEEGRRIGVDDVVLISQVRECMRGPVLAQSGSAFVTTELKTRLSENDSKNGITGGITGVMVPNLSEVC